MADRIRTKGDLCGLYIAEESSYGIPVAGAAAFSGRLLSFSDAGKIETDSLPVCGRRTSTGSFVVQKAHGFSATMTLPRGQGLLGGWLDAAMGGDGTVGEELPSFTAILKVGPKEWHLYAGCRVESLEVSAPSIGRAVEVSVTVSSAEHVMTPSEASVSGDAVTFTIGSSTHTFTPEADPQTAPVTYTEFPTVDNAQIKSQSWRFSVVNDLYKVPDVSSSGDYAVECGADSIPQGVSLSAELTSPSRCYSRWDLMRLVNSPLNHTAVIEADGTAVTLTGGTLDGAGPSRASAGVYDESASFTFEDATYGDA